MQQMAKLCIRSEYRNNKQNIVYIHAGHSKFMRKTGLWKHILCTRAHTIHFQIVLLGSFVLFIHVRERADGF